MKRNHQIIFSVLLVVFAFTTIVACLQFRRTQSVRSTFPDTLTYTSAAQASLFSPKLWAGERAPIYPLFIKLCRGNLTCIVRGQLLLSITCWAFLAFCCVYVLFSPLAKILGFTLIQTLALTPNVAMWHKVILSESVSFSLMAACVGCWLLFAHRRRLFTTMLAVFTTAVWVGVRDTNAYLALLLAASMFLALVYQSMRIRMASRHITHPHIIAASALLLILFVGSNLSSNRGQRWLAPFYNNMAQRIITNEASIHWFASRGMPSISVLKERRWEKRDWVFEKDTELTGFREWSRHHGKSTYAKWLMLHPGYTFYEAMRKFAYIFDADISEYAPRDFRPVILNPCAIRGLSATVFFSFCLMGLLTCFCLWPMVLQSNTINVGVVTVPVFLFVSLMPQHIVVWHGDAMEIIRHSAQTVLQAKIALVLLIACATDMAFILFNARQGNRR